MADEITTQTTQTTQTTPAGGAVQTTDPAPTAEQKNAFQKFMESLFNGKAKRNRLLQIRVPLIPPHLLRKRKQLTRPL